MSVPVVSPERTELPRTTTQPATVHAYFQADISAKISGYLTELNADIGQPVGKGEVLAVIDVPELEKQYQAKQADIQRLEAEQRRAAADLIVAEAGATAREAEWQKARAELTASDALLTAATVERARVADLVERRAVADRLLDEATKKLEAASAQKTALQSAVTGADAEWALARAQRDAAAAQVQVAQATTEVARRELQQLDALRGFAQLKAPFKGIVTERHVDLGDLVRDAQTSGGPDDRPLFVVTRLDPVRVRVPVPERDAPLVDVGDGVQLTLQAFGSRIFTGQVARLAGVLDQHTRTMLVEMELPNPDGQLLPGMFGQATIAVEPAREKIVLPASAIRYDESGHSFVYVVNDANEIEIVSVETGWDTGQEIEVASGLTGNERVVGPMLGRLKAGQKVSVD